MSRPAEVIIDLAALRYNFNQVRSLTTTARIMAVVKADAYGHGLIYIAQALDDADAFGVVCLEEARQLRQAGIQKRVILLEGHYVADELIEISQLDLDVVVHNLLQIDMLKRMPLEHPINVWLKLDTGMHRLGFLSGSAQQALTELQHAANVKEICLMTHLASTNNRDSTMAVTQIERFNQFCGALNLPRTIANSAAVMTLPEAHVDWIRPGIMLYGISPFNDSYGQQEGLKPVMTLRSKLISVKLLKAGDSVGYGAAWQCPEDMPIGIIAAGYGDGYPRHVRTGTPVLVNGKRVSLIGNVSMDMLMVDLRSQPDAEVGDPAVLWGASLPVEEIAACATTIPYDLVCAVCKRLKFHYDQN